MNNPLPTEQLRALHLPAEPGWWPPAPGWWIVAALLLLAIITLLWAFAKCCRESRWKSIALREVEAIVAMPTATVQQQMAKIQCCSVLLRRVAMVLLARNDVAGVTGEAWLKTLDKLGRTQAFSRGIGRLLLNAPYQRPRGEDNFCHDIAALIALLRQTIKRGRRQPQKCEGSIP